jgi:23S rRNA (guanine745-N1)-methyltransferase
MPVTDFDRLACPLDGQPLSRQGTAWQCPGGHSFDIARQGYVHLLPVQNKRSRDPGDSKAMVAARQRFLNAGYYQAVASAVNEVVLAGVGSWATCLDAGCGEGYYLRQLSDAVPETLELSVLGLDVSKWAVLSAAKQDSKSTWVVGTNAHLPVTDNSIDRLLCVFGFPVFEEFARVIKPQGRLVMVDPGPDHLRELREVIYPTLNERPESGRTHPGTFQPLSTDAVTQTLMLEGEQNIADLLAMTPHLFRAPASGIEKVSALTRLEVTLDVRVRVLTPAVEFQT